MKSSIFLFLAALAMVFASHGIAPADTILFSDDFESDTAGTMPDDAAEELHPVIGTGDVGGSWTFNDPTGTLVQVWNNENPGNPDNDPGDNNYVAVTRTDDGSGQLRPSDWDQAATMNELVRLSFSIWMPSTNTISAGIWQSNGGFDIRMLPTGGILFYADGALHATDLTFTRDAWVDVVAELDMETRTYSLTVEGETEDSLYWTDDIHSVWRITFDNCGGNDRYFVDNVEFSVVPEPSALLLTLSALLGLIAYAWRGRRNRVH